MRQVVIFFFGLIVMFGCAKRATTTGTSAGAGKYSEDLSVWRPEATAPVDAGNTKRTGHPEQRIRTDQYTPARYAVNEQVDVVLDSIHEQNLSRRAVDGYTIQVYSGTKREDALNVKKRMSQSLPDLESDVQYRQPNFRVRTGKYLTRLEAQKDYLAVKRHFPNAIVIPDRIELQ